MINISSISYALECEINDVLEKHKFKPITKTRLNFIKTELQELLRKYNDKRHIKVSASVESYSLTISFSDTDVDPLIEGLE